jgi:hypothetical protein
MEHFVIDPFYVTTMGPFHFPASTRIFGFFLFPSISKKGTGDPATDEP